MNRQAKSEIEQSALPGRVGVLSFSAMFLVSCVLAEMTARECHFNFELHHLTTSFTPSLLFGIATWFWWVAVATGLWTCAKRRPALLHFSAKRGLFHLVLACLLGLSHLLLLQRIIEWDSARWPAWGQLYANLDLLNVSLPQRYGVELVIYAVIYGFSALLYSQNQTQRTKFQKLEVERQLTQAQLKALQMQMEPHFLFNTLNAITSLVAQKRNSEAMKTLGHLNTILRTTLQRKAPEKVPFAEELKIVESYLAIQKVRFSDRLQVKIDATPEALDGLVPCFLLQPIVENAIQHGIAPRAAGGSIETCVKRIGDKLWMQVRDDGCGPNGSATKGHGIGMQNVRERLAYFYPDDYEFGAVAPTSGGYEVTIQIPYERAIV